VIETGEKGDNLTSVASITEEIISRKQNNKMNKSAHLVQEKCRSVKRAMASMASVKHVDNRE
jgi:hypothetical protein